MTGKPLILAVDRNTRNLELLSRFLGKDGYQVITAASLEVFDQVLAAHPISLALLDITGFGPVLWEHCEQLRQKDIPFLLISAKKNPSLPSEGAVRNAHGVLSKPLQVAELLTLVRRLAPKSI